LLSTEGRARNSPGRSARNSGQICARLNQTPQSPTINSACKSASIGEAPSIRGDLDPRPRQAHGYRAIPIEQCLSRERQSTKLSFNQTRPLFNGVAGLSDLALHRAARPRFSLARYRVARQAGGFAQASPPSLTRAGGTRPPLYPRCDPGKVDHESPAPQTYVWLLRSLSISHANLRTIEPSVSILLVSLLIGTADGR
jgi:hypothetical protein